MFLSLQKKATKLGTKLLLEQPSDLFQTETSFVFDGNDVTLLVHVPMVDNSALLRLYRFLPFPLSYSDTHSLTPRPHKALFAISSNDPRLSLEISDADLEGCYRVNSLHLCERLGVLNRRLDQTCLGALYNQHFKLAMSLCNMDVTISTERVVQMNDNWFLIYSIKAYTGLVSCRNGTSGEVHLKIGVNKVPLSASCRLSLQDHVLFADTALKESTRVKTVEWELDDDDFSFAEVADAQDILADTAATGAASPTLADVRAQSAQSKKHPRYWVFFLLCGIVGFIGLFVWVMCFLVTHKWWLIRRTLQVIADRVWPSADPEALYEGRPDEAEVRRLQPHAAADPQLQQPPPPPYPAAVARQPPRAGRRSSSQPPELPNAIARTRARLLV